MSRRGWKILVSTVLILLTIMVLLGTAGAEGRKLITRIQRPGDYMPRRGGPLVSGPTRGVTCEAYTYTVNIGNTGAVTYQYLMTIDDDPRSGMPLDTLYQSPEIDAEYNEFQYTFYQEGTYVAFVFFV